MSSAQAFGASSTRLIGSRPFLGGVHPFRAHAARSINQQSNSTKPARAITKVVASKKAPPAHIDEAGYARVHNDAHITDVETYQKMYKRSVEDPAGFWRDIALENFFWETPPAENHMSYNFDVRNGPIYSKWFEGGRTNITYNALDRHVKAGHGDQACFLFEGNDPGRDGKMTYKQVLDEVCRVANWLKAQGIKKGDAVAIYMPMVCELPIAMLACARIGAVHSVVFGGFSAEALADRIEDCKARVVITASGVMRATKKIDLKAIADAALATCAKRGFQVQTSLVYGNDDFGALADIPMVSGRDVLWQDVIPSQSADCPVEWVESEHPLFLLYTSGSTGKPKGVLHTTAGYMVSAATTTKYSFALHAGDVYWCTADCGWITGHSYLTYGPLINRATAVVFEGVPSHPTPSRCWEVVEKYKVKQFYTAPTAIRSLMRSGNEYAQKNDLSSLEILGTVGEPINPEAWRWYHEIVGDGRCPVVDTWWQTETGAHMIVPLPTAWAEKPGSATLPFFGVVPVLVDEKGNELEGPAEGYLCIKQTWPSAIRTVYGDQDRFETTYFAPFPGYYFTGDGARRDEDGYYWITGRVDDVINVSGHRIGTAEVESALVSHDDCAEAAVVGYEHPVKGQGIWAYVSLVDGKEYSDELKKALVKQVREQIGPFAAPDVIHWAPHLPKTRSGKIMRRVLRKIAANEEDQLGDVSTLADPNVVDILLDMRGNPKIAALDDGLAAKPVMGWNSWNAFGGNIDEDLIRQTADDIGALGLADAGYSYINIDDGWSEPLRDQNGNLQANAQRFPSGISALADYVHSKGLKLGIYSDSGTYTCLGFPGSRGFEVQDAKLWAEWGIDYLKYDNCYTKSDDWVIDRYIAMRDALNSTGRPIVFSLCEWGVQAPWLWASKVGHSWRTTVDISPSWSSILLNLDNSLGLSRFAGPDKGWNDLDMLEIGNGELTPEQERSHFVLWSMLKAPLLLGTRIADINPDTLALLKNKELIAMHQDELGVAGDLIWKQGAREVYACPLKGGDRAVVLFNRHFIEYRPTMLTVKWAEVGLPPHAAAKVRDMVNQKDLGEFVGEFTAVVAPNDVVAVRISLVEVVQGVEDWRPWQVQSIYAEHREEIYYSGNGTAGGPGIVQGRKDGGRFMDVPKADL